MDVHDSEMFQGGVGGDVNAVTNDNDEEERTRRDLDALDSFLDSSLSSANESSPQSLTLLEPTPSESTASTVASASALLSQTPATDASVTETAVVSSKPREGSLSRVAAVVDSDAVAAPWFTDSITALSELEKGCAHSAPAHSNAQTLSLLRHIHRCTLQWRTTFTHIIHPHKSRCCGSS
jgi:hypothetical protein